MSISNPRLAAFQILLRIEKERSYADILIDRELSLGGLKGPDRGFLTELVYGVLRSRGHLDHIIGHFSKKPVEKLERAVLILLRLGLYQEFYLDRVPVSAAVNETVQLAHQFAPRATGFINAILRGADRERDRIPYPVPGKDPVGYVSSRYSNPAWITRGWIEQLGVEGAEALGRANLQQPPLTVRVNSLKTDRETVIGALAAEGVAAEPGRFSPYSLHLSSPVQIGTLATFREGLITVQDESSQMASLFLSPLPDETILDLCAAPGGKTTHLAQLMENRGDILACDISARKLELVMQTADRLGITIIRTKAVREGAEQQSAGGLFQRILLDAPCSGLGVLRRNPEGKWWKTAEDVQRLSLIQKRLLAAAADLLLPGGTLLYSTCSTTVQENEAVIAEFLAGRQDFAVEDLRELFPRYRELITENGFFRSWPHIHGMDGFFAARLRKMG